MKRLLIYLGLVAGIFVSGSSSSWGAGKATLALDDIDRQDFAMKNEYSLYPSYTDIERNTNGEMKRLRDQIVASSTGSTSSAGSAPSPLTPDETASLKHIQSKAYTCTNLSSEYFPEGKIISSPACVALLLNFDPAKEWSHRVNVPNNGYYGLNLRGTYLLPPVIYQALPTSSSSSASAMNYMTRITWYGQYNKDLIGKFVDVIDADFTDLIGFVDIVSSGHATLSAVSTPPTEDWSKKYVDGSEPKPVMLYSILEPMMQDFGKKYFKTTYDTTGLEKVLDPLGQQIFFNLLCEALHTGVASPEPVKKRPLNQVARLLKSSPNADISQEVYTIVLRLSANLNNLYNLEQILTYLENNQAGKARGGFDLTMSIHY